jgi:tetratricopeptide (TPR) repeat protein
MLHYNLANHYQSINRRRDAIRQYIAAVRKLPDYYNRDYWQREFAGMLFLEKRYTCSAKIYEMCLKSERLSKEPLTFALAADASFFTRHLTHSLDLFEKYSEMEKKPELEFILKRQAIKTIADRFGIEGPFSPSKAAKLYAQLETAGELNSKEKLSECLVLDPLNPQACFQEGILLMKEEKFEEACIAFLISALVAEWNVSAWLNSFFAAFEVKSHMMGMVLKVAYKKCGYKLIEVLREEFLDKTDVPISLKKNMIDALCAQFQMYDNEAKHSHETSTI